VGHIQTAVRMQCQALCHIVSDITVPLKAENPLNNWAHINISKRA